jgi:thiamine pyrophosphate-dependent acetolactate synthase large subunit-like protein
LNELTNGDAIITTDVGQHQMVACRYAKFNNSKSSVTSGGLGTMGFGLRLLLELGTERRKKQLLQLLEMADSR